MPGQTVARQLDPVTQHANAWTAALAGRHVEAARGFVGLFNASDAHLQASPDQHVMALKIEHLLLGIMSMLVNTLSPQGTGIVYDRPFPAVKLLAAHIVEEAALPPFAAFDRCVCVTYALEPL